MKLFGKSVTAVAVVAFSLAAGTAVSQAFVEREAPASPAASDPAPNGVNEFGESFGPEGFGDSYDLIAATGDDGRFGYVRSEDLNGPDFRTPEEALAWQAEHVKEHMVIPLYESDGRTVIGQFTMVTVLDDLKPGELPSNW